MGQGTRSWRWVGALAGLALLVACSAPAELPPEEAERLRGLFQGGLESPDAYVRAETVRAMGLVRSPQLLDLLGQAGGDESRMVRLGSALGVAAVEPEASQSALLDLLSDGDPRLRRVTGEEALALLPPGEARDAVIAAGLKSSEPALRLRVVRYGLGPQLKSEEEGRRRDAQAALSRAVEDSDPAVAGAALRLLVQEGGQPERLTPILERARARDLGALQTLQHARLDGSREALEAVRSGQGEAALEAWIGLAALGDEAAVDPLRDALGPASAALKRRILLGLGYGGSAAGLRVMRPLRDDAQEEVRCAVYEGLGFHKKAGEDDFLRGLRDPAPAVGVAAALGLVRSNPEALDRVFKIVLREEEHRQRAMEVLISALERLRLDGEEALLGKVASELEALEGELRPLSADKAPDTRSAAAELLFWGGDPMARLGAIPEPTSEVRYAWASALAARPLEGRALEAVEPLQQVQGEVQVLEIMAGAGIWSAYRRAAQPAAE